MNGIVVGCDHEETCPRIYRMVVVIMTSLNRTSLTCEKELATCYRQGQTSVVELWSPSREQTWTRYGSRKPKYRPSQFRRPGLRNTTMLKNQVAKNLATPRLKSARWAASTAKLKSDRQRLVSITTVLRTLLLHCFCTVIKKRYMVSPGKKSSSWKGKWHIPNKRFIEEIENNIQDGVTALADIHFCGLESFLFKGSTVTSLHFSERRWVVTKRLKHIVQTQVRIVISRSQYPSKVGTSVQIKCKTVPK